MAIFNILLNAILGCAAAAGAGALSGIKLGGNQLGVRLAASMGGFYGLLSGSGAVALGLVITNLL